MPWIASSDQRKLESAEDHLHDFRIASQKFSENPPIRITTRDLDARRAGIYVDNVEDWARRLLTDQSLIAGDAIHNARAALDHWVYEVADTRNKHTQFPVWDSVPAREKFDERLRQCGLGATPTAVRDALWGIQPWPEGVEIGRRLWLLHQLDIADKHHVLSTSVMSSTTRESVVPIPLPSGGAIAMRYVESFPLVLEPNALLWSGTRALIPAAMATAKISFKVHLVDSSINRLAMSALPAEQLLQDLVSASRDAVFELAPLAFASD